MYLVMLAVVLAIDAGFFGVHIFKYNVDGQQTFLDESPDVLRMVIGGGGAPISTHNGSGTNVSVSVERVEFAIDLVCSSYSIEIETF